MKVIETAIPDVKLLKPKVFGDERGFFFESYNQNCSHPHNCHPAARPRDPESLI